MRGFRKIIGGPVGRFLFVVFAVYAMAVWTFGGSVTISILDTGTVGVGLVFSFYVAREVWRTMQSENPERAQLWAVGTGLVLGSTALIRSMHIFWTITEQPWISTHWLFGGFMASQWAGFVLCLAALVAPDDGTIFGGTRRPMVTAAILAAVLAALVFGAKYALR